VEQPWQALVRPTVARADYLAQLVRTYGLVAPFESACKYTPNLPRILDTRQQSRAGLLALDLLALGLSASQIASIPQCPTAASFADVNEALGWLYVIERATPAHDTVRLHLASVIPEVESACSFLAAHDTHAQHRWEQFASALDRASEVSELAIIGSAQEAFDEVHHWLRGGMIPIARISAGT
jgi:heme oxygenase (biliverdin-IX-beta and delta-forming)